MIRARLFELRQRMPFSFAVWELGHSIEIRMRAEMLSDNTPKSALRTVRF
jgi:hypothetical protein